MLTFKQFLIRVKIWNKPRLLGLVMGFCSFSLAHATLIIHPIQSETQAKEGGSTQTGDDNKRMFNSSSQFGSRTKNMAEHVTTITEFSSPPSESRLQNLTPGIKAETIHKSSKIASPPSFYQIDMPAKNQGAEEKPALIQSAFKIFLMRITGSDSIYQIPAIQKALQDPTQYVKQYSYLETSKNNFKLRVQFDENSVNDLLIQSGQTAWLENRPLTLVWIVVEEADHSQTFVGSEEQAELGKTCQDLSEQLGLPIAFPLLDLADQLEISTQTVADALANPLRESGKRYGADSVLAGKIYPKEGNWQGHWVWLTDGESQAWNTSGHDSVAVLNQGLQNLTTRLVTASKKGTASKTETVLMGNTLDNNLLRGVSSPASSQPSSLSTPSRILNPPSEVSDMGLKNSESSQNSEKQFLVGVSGIGSLEQYAKVLDHLWDLPSVKQIEVFRVLGDQTVFRVESASGEIAFLQAIRAAGFLKEVPLSVRTDPNVPEYTLVESSKSF